MEISNANIIYLVCSDDIANMESQISLTFVKLAQLELRDQWSGFAYL